MARAIDADELLKQQYKMGFRQMPVVSVDAIKNAPTLTPPNEPLALDRTELLRKLFPMGIPRTREDWNYAINAQAVYRAIMAVHTSPNEPLTPDQLREMKGEPVWCCGLNDCTVGSWMLVGKRCCENMESVAGFEDYGVEWLAYRRPPEGEEDA